VLFLFSSLLPFGARGLVSAHGFSVSDLLKLVGALSPTPFAGFFGGISGLIFWVIVRPDLNPRRS
jgi:hypothetical protein